ncbi:MAG TPA: CHAD domain-containing protein [Acetobacteraceae bacterium]|nr:CHAD domain-containing protein [Acetobacteraceae bacterium]
MELELCLDPDDASRLPRLKLLAAATRGRAQPQRIVWHDSLDAALTADGLALARERNLWRLERLVPDPAEAWPPGAPPPVLAQAADFSAVGHDLPEPLAPVVAFVGRRHSYGLETAQGAVTLSLTRGTLRAVATERAASRVHLSGDDHAVLQLALALAGELRLAVPLATLAGEALCTARASAPLPRRLGAPHLPEGLGISDAFAFVLAHLTEVVLHFAPFAAEDVSGPEPVHQMRVALRRLRSAVTVFQRVIDGPELAAATAGLKALSTRLGPTRDWDVFLGETMPAVSAAFPNEPKLARLIAAGERRRRECHAALRDFLRSAEFRRLGIGLAWLAAARSWYPAAAEGPEQFVSLREFASDVLHRRRRKLLRTDDIAALDPRALHALRLQAKRARYAAEIFAPLYPGKAPRRFIHRLTAVQDGLGQLNDRATAEKLLAELGGVGGRHAYAAGLVLGFAVAGTTAEVLPRVMRRWEKFQRAAAFWE